MWASAVIRLVTALVLNLCSHFTIAKCKTQGCWEGCFCWSLFYCKVNDRIGREGRGTIQTKLQIPAPTVWNHSARGEGRRKTRGGIPKSAWEQSESAALSRRFATTGFAEREKKTVERTISTIEWDSWGTFGYGVAERWRDWMSPRWRGKHHQDAKLTAKQQPYSRGSL